MASKFAEFIETNKIDPRRIRAASKKIEQLRREDRELKVAKKKGDEAAKDKKPRSGRAVTERLLASAAAGSDIPAPAKARLLRAVNRVLEQKKKDVVDLTALF